MEDVRKRLHTQQLNVASTAITDDHHQGISTRIKAKRDQTKMKRNTMKRYKME
jgi:hypothetical protein